MPIDNNIKSTADLVVELKKKGLDSKEILDIADRIGNAAKSSSDGHCMRPDIGAERVNPAVKER